MAKGPRSRAKNGGSKKKSLESQKVEIEKLIDISKANAASPPNSKPNAAHPSKHATGPHPFRENRHTYPSKQTHLRSEPKQIISGLQEPETQHFLIYDGRCLENPGIPLVRLPCEPPSSRAFRYVPKGQFPFLQLPGELRNKIYDFAIEGQDYSIFWINGTQKSKSLTCALRDKPLLLQPRLPPHTAERRRSLDFCHRRAINQHLAEEDIRPGPTPLLLVCKLLSEETASVFYSKSMFYFKGLGALRHFLDHLRPIAMSSIRRLGLEYRAYGNPLKSENQPWKEKHDRLWENLCWRVADQCSLTLLDLDLTLNPAPVSFVPFDYVDPDDLGAQWIKPLWAFQDAGIERCWGRVRCDSQDDALLEVQSQEMRKEIIGELWDEEAECKRDAYGVDFGGRKRKTLAAEMNGRVLRIGGDGVWGTE